MRGVIVLCLASALLIACGDDSDSKRYTYKEDAGAVGAGGGSTDVSLSGVTYGDCAKPVVVSEIDSDQRSTINCDFRSFDPTCRRPSAYMILVISDSTHCVTFTDQTEVCDFHHCRIET